MGTHERGIGANKHTRTFVVEDELGLHMRPAAVLAQVAKSFQATVMFTGNGMSADAKCILSLLRLGAARGTELTVTADGVDAPDALFAIEQASCLVGLEPQTWKDVDFSRPPEQDYQTT